MAEVKSLDYTKIMPLLPSILKLVEQAGTEQEKKLLMEVLVQDALRRTTTEIVGAQRQLQEQSRLPDEAKQASDKDDTQDSAAADEQTDDEPSSASIFSNGATLSLQKIDVFLKKHKGLEPLIGALFIKSNDKIERIYSSLKTAKKSEAQLRVALLQCLAQAIESGKFSTTLDAVKQECKDFNVFDTNFTTHLKKNVSLFKDGDTSEQIELNEKGQSALAETVKAMTQEG